MAAFDKQGRSLGIYSRRRVKGSRSWSLHACGRAVDWAPSTPGRGDELAASIAHNYLRWPVQLIIWRRRQWGGRRGPGWRRYWGRNPHNDHLHVEVGP